MAFPRIWTCRQKLADGGNRARGVSRPHQFPRFFAHSRQRLSRQLRTLIRLPRELAGNLFVLLRQRGISHLFEKRGKHPKRPPVPRECIYHLS